jgi:hypothetical protein
MIGCTQWPLLLAGWMPPCAAMPACGSWPATASSSQHSETGSINLTVHLARSDQQLEHRINHRIDHRIEHADATVSAAALEHTTNLLTAVRDATWSLRKDRIRTALAVDGLAGVGASRSALAAYLSIQQVLSAIDRLEVRGRDSAGVHVMVWNHGLSTTDARVAGLLGSRHDDSLFTSRSVRVTRNAWSFVYKAAAEIGELGDNTRAMRTAIIADDLLRLLVSQPDAQVGVLGPHPLGECRHHL